MQQIVVITGGAGGIGSQTSLAFAHAGYRVVVADRHLEAGEALVAQGHGQIEFVPTDVCDEASLHDLRQHLSTHYGHITHLLNLAGRAHPEEFKPLSEISPAALAESIQLNLTSQLNIIQTLLPLLLASTHADRSITAISSINAIKAYGRPAYSSAKAGLLGMVQALALELGAKGIRVNAVLPGTVLTPLALSEPKDFDRLIQGSLLGRVASVEEIAEVILSIAIRLTCLTGQAIVADCGQSAKGYR